MDGAHNMNDGTSVIHTCPVYKRHICETSHFHKAIHT